MANEVRVNGRLIPAIEEDFQSKVALGFSPYHVYGRKFADRSKIDLGETADIWNYLTEDFYTYSTTADIDTISGSDVNDVQVISIFGLDGDYVHVEQTITLDGQNKVTLDTPLMRVYRLRNEGSVSIAGEVFLYVNGDITLGVPDDTTTVRAYIFDGDNQTLMSQYTVPAGHTLLLTNLTAAFSKSQAATAIINAKIRPFGGVFQTKSRFAVSSQGSSQYIATGLVPVAVEEKSDINFTATSDANNVGLSLAYQFFLVDNNYLSSKQRL